MKFRSARVVSAAVLSLSLIICAIIFTATWSGVNRSTQTISVVGSSKMNIVSDIGLLRGNINIVSKDVKEGYQTVKDQLPRVIQYLEKNGIKKDMIEVQPVTSYANYAYTEQGFQTGQILSYNISQRFVIRSNDVQKIKAISLEITDLVQQGIPLQTDQPEYYYSKLADVKISIQSEAAKDAQTRAKQIAASTNSTLGAMRSAKMGVMQITPKNSNVVADYGINDVSSIEKEITAVVHAAFEID